MIPRALKLIVNDHDGTVMLFDLGADPGELRNLVPEKADRTAALRDVLTEFTKTKRVGQEQPVEVPLDEELLEQLEPPRRVDLEPIPPAPHPPAK